MSEVPGVAARLQPLLTRVLGEQLPVRICAWDGSEIGPPDAPAFVVNSRRALRRLLWKPGELGLARAYVAGELDIEGDVFAALGAVLAVVQRGNDHGIRLTGDDKRELLRTAVTLGAVGPEPQPPAEEAQLSGRGVGEQRDAPSAGLYGDAGQVFCEYLLGPTLGFSSAYWTRPDDPGYSLEEAQRDAFEVIARKLDLAPGVRLLDTDCGWGSLLLHVAEHHGVRGVGLAASAEQADHARKRVAQAGLSDRVEIRSRDLGEVTDGPYEAVASIGMAEYAGPERYAGYAADLTALLAPGGRLLNQQIVRRPGPTAPRPTFMTSYVFPNGDLMPLGEALTALEEAGLEVRDVESLSDHYIRTLRCWVDNLRAHWDDCVAVAAPGRLRVWLLYLAGLTLALEAGRAGVHQTVALCRVPRSVAAS